MAAVGLLCHFLPMCGSGASFMLDMPSASIRLSVAGVFPCLAVAGNSTPYSLMSGFPMKRLFAAFCFLCLGLPAWSVAGSLSMPEEEMPTTLTKREIQVGAPDSPDFEVLEYWDLRREFPDLKDTDALSYEEEAWTAFTKRLESMYGEFQGDFFWLRVPEGCTPECSRFLLLDGNILQFVPIRAPLFFRDDENPPFIYRQVPLPVRLQSMEIDAALSDALRSAYQFLYRRQPPVGRLPSMFMESVDAHVPGAMICGPYRADCFYPDRTDYYWMQFNTLMDMVYQAAALGYLGRDEQLWLQWKARILAEGGNPCLWYSACLGKRRHRGLLEAEKSELAPERLASMIFPAFQGKWSLMAVDASSGSVCGYDADERGILSICTIVPDVEEYKVPEGYVSLRRVHHLPVMTEAEYAMMENRLVNVEVEYAVMPEREVLDEVEQRVGTMVSRLLPGGGKPEGLFWVRQGGGGVWLNSGADAWLAMGLAGAAEHMVSWMPMVYGVCDDEYEFSRKIVQEFCDTIDDEIQNDK